MTSDDDKGLTAEDVRRATDRVHIKHAIQMAERDHRQVLEWMLRRYLEKL